MDAVEPADRRSGSDESIDALLMCGGKGTRLDTPVEKPLFEIAGEPMVERVRRALVAASRIDEVYAAVSPHTPETGEFLADRCSLVDTPGDGYVADLSVAVERTDRPVLTVVADLPLLDEELLDRVAAAWIEHRSSMAVTVPTALKRQLGVTVESDRSRAPTGLNVVDTGDGERTYTSYDARLAVNVNTLDDAAVAERLLPESKHRGERAPKADEEETNGS